MLVLRRMLLRVLFQVDQQVWEMRCLAVERGRRSGVMLPCETAILAAASTSFPCMLVWEGTHWSLIPQPWELRWVRVSCVAWIKGVAHVGCCERRCSDDRESVYMTALPLAWVVSRYVRAWWRA